MFDETLTRGWVLARNLCKGILTTDSQAPCHSGHTVPLTQLLSAFVCFSTTPSPLESGLHTWKLPKVMNYLRSGLNLSTTVVRPPDGSWGILDKETGRWGGMVGMVDRNEVDFGLGEIVTTQQVQFALKFQLCSPNQDRSDSGWTGLKWLTSPSPSISTIL